MRRRSNNRVGEKERIMGSEGVLPTTSPESISGTRLPLFTNDGAPNNADGHLSLALDYSSQSNAGILCLSLAFALLKRV